MLVRMTWYTDDSVTTIRDDDDVVSLSVLYMLGAMNNVSSDGTHPNDNNTTTSSSSLTDAVAVASPWVRRVYST